MVVDINCSHINRVSVLKTQTPICKTQTVLYNDQQTTLGRNKMGSSNTTQPWSPWYYRLRDILNSKNMRKHSSMFKSRTWTDSSWSKSWYLQEKKVKCTYASMICKDSSSRLEQNINIIFGVVSWLQLKNQEATSTGSICTCLLAADSHKPPYGFLNTVSNNNWSLQLLYIWQ